MSPKINQSECNDHFCTILCSFILYCIHSGHFIAMWSTLSEFIHWPTSGRVFKLLLDNIKFPWINGILHSILLFSYLWNISNYSTFHTLQRTHFSIIPEYNSHEYLIHEFYFATPRTFEWISGGGPTRRLLLHALNIRYSLNIESVAPNIHGTSSSGSNPSPTGFAHTHPSVAGY